MKQTKNESEAHEQKGTQPQKQTEKEHTRADSDKSGSKNGKHPSSKKDKDK